MEIAQRVLPNFHRGSPRLERESPLTTDSAIRQLAPLALDADGKTVDKVVDKLRPHPWQLAQMPFRASRGGRFLSTT